MLCLKQYVLLPKLFTFIKFISPLAQKYGTYNLRYI